MVCEQKSKQESTMFFDRLCAFLCILLLLCSGSVLVVSAQNNYTIEELEMLQKLDNLTLEAIQHNHQSTRNACTHSDEIQNIAYCECISSECFSLPMEEEYMAAYHNCFLQCLCSIEEPTVLPFSRGLHYGKLHLTSTQLLEQEKLRFCVDA